MKWRSGRERRIGAEPSNAFASTLNRNGGQCSKVRLHPALESEVVVDFICGGLVGKTVDEIECSDAGFHLVRRREGRRNVGGHFHLWSDLRIDLRLGARRYDCGHNQ
jgi:hypothetical protein